MEKFSKYPSYKLASTIAVIRSQNEIGATKILGNEMEEELKRRRSEIGSETFISNLINRIAEVSVSTSALRNQGASGIIEICREHFKEIDLFNFCLYLNSLNYHQYLNEETRKLLDKFPPQGKSWGAARKALNLFFRDVCYNHYLREYLELPSKDKPSIFQNLEIPLDRDVAQGLYSARPDLPKWKSIKSLTPAQNEAYQKAALYRAKEQHTLRIHLDMEYWRIKDKSKV